MLFTFRMRDNLYDSPTRRSSRKQSKSEKEAHEYQRQHSIRRRHTCANIEVSNSTKQQQHQGNGDNSTASDVVAGTVAKLPQRKFSFLDRMPHIIKEKPADKQKHLEELATKQHKEEAAAACAATGQSNSKDKYRHKENSKDHSFNEKEHHQHKDKEHGHHHHQQNGDVKKSGSVEKDDQKERQRKDSAGKERKNSTGKERKDSTGKERKDSTGKDRKDSWGGKERKDSLGKERKNRKDSSGKEHEENEHQAAIAHCDKKDHGKKHQDGKAHVDHEAGDKIDHKLDDKKQAVEKMTTGHQEKPKKRDKKSHSESSS